jgi:hypothetical protein
VERDIANIIEKVIVEIVELDFANMSDQNINAEIAELGVVNMEKINIIVRNVELDSASMVNEKINAVIVELDVVNMVKINIIARNVVVKNANAKSVQKSMRKFNQRSDHEFRHSRIIKI